MEDDSKRLDGWMREVHARIIQLGTVLDPSLWGPVPPAEVYGALRELEARARRMREELRAVTSDAKSANDDVHELVAERDALKKTNAELLQRIDDLYGKSAEMVTDHKLELDAAWIQFRGAEAEIAKLRARIERLTAQRNIAHQNYIDSAEALRDRTDALQSAARVIAELAVVAEEIQPDPMPVSETFIDDEES